MPKEHTAQFISDRRVPVDQFVLRKGGEDVAGGTLNMFNQIPELFEWGSYDQIVLHPRNHAQLPLHLIDC